MRQRWRRMTTTMMMLLLLLLLGCRSALAARSLVTCDDALASVSISVLVPCPNVTGDEVMFTLQREGRLICKYTCRNQADSYQCDDPCKSEFHVRPHGSEGGQLDGLVVTAAMNQSSVTYGCQGELVFPPPYKEFLSSPVVLVLVKGRQCDHNTNQNQPGGGQGPFWVWIMALALLGIYSLAITVLAAVSWVKLRSTDSQNEYMNTKPQTVRNHHRNCGNQTPTPRHL